MATSRISKSNSLSTKQNINKPSSVHDCQIVIKRTSDESATQNQMLNEFTGKLNDMEKQITHLQQQIQVVKSDISSTQHSIAQNSVNLSALNGWLDELKIRDEAASYDTRCVEYLSKYIWHDDDNDDEAEQKYFPADTFNFLDINDGEYTTLDNLTSQEIRKLAHYVHACEILNSNKSNLPSQRRNLRDPDSSESEYNYIVSGYKTYGYLYNATDSDLVIGDERLCDGELPEDADEICCHKRFAWRVTDIFNEYFTLDATDILSYERIN
jgi:hypothetical protein